MSRFTPLVFLTLGLALAPSAGAQRVTAIDLARSEIRFAGKQMGVPAEGRFGKFTAQVEFDPAKLASSKVIIEVDLNSIDTGAAESDIEVKGKAWFDLAAFPTAKFVSTGIKALGGVRYEAAGKLSIKGRTRDVTAPFTVRKDGTTAVFEGAFTLLRLQFGVGEGPWGDTETVADAVQVRFKLTGMSKG